MQAIHMKFLVLEQEKEKKVLISVFNFRRHLFAPQARRKIELTFCISNLSLGLHGHLSN
jgi:hypothetical protein